MDLLEKIDGYRPMLVHIELRHRRIGPTPGGKFSDLSMIRITPDDGEGSESIYNSVIESCEKKESAEGEALSWEAKLVITVDEGKGTARKTIPVRFDLHGGLELGSPREESLKSYADLVKAQNELIGRQHGYMEKIVSTMAQQAEAFGKVASGQAELKKVEYEHEREMKKADREAESDAEFNQMIAEHGPKFLAVLMASGARKQAGKSGEKKSGWRHLRDACREAFEAGGHAPDIADLLDAMANADGRKEMEALFHRLNRAIVAHGIDKWQWIVRYPSMLPVLDFLSDLPGKDEHATTP
jgi:hypothetical protein